MPYKRALKTIMRPIKSAMRSFISLLKKILSGLGYQLEISLFKYYVDENKLNLNVGAGKYPIPGFKSLDIFTKQYYKNKDEFLKKRVEYDIRKSKIPYQTDSVDNIYISHVIEHVEYDYVYNFIQESFRVLKKGGVLRIACPDGEFLYNASQFKNDYWKWRHSTFSVLSNLDVDSNLVDQYCFLIRELASPKCFYYKNNIKSVVINSNDVESFDYVTLKNLMRENLAFRAEYPGDHINVWDFDELAKLAQDTGFSHVLKSKFQGSVSASMQGPLFDKTYPQMSLYVDMVK